MSKYVPDILSHRWVIIAQSRQSRPDDSTHHKNSACVFCPGQEHIAQGEVYRVGKGEKDMPGWSVRVIANKFPITDYHEVIIHSPTHDQTLETLPLAHVELVLKTYKARYGAYQKTGQVLIFCNQGEHAGASIDHSHSQLVVIPFQINLDALTQEPISNVVETHDLFTVYCPDFSQWPYEVWVTPKKKGGVFGDIDEKEIKELARIMQHLLKKLRGIHEKHHLSNLEFGYNFYIYPKENWYLRIIPRFVQRAGFELGTGLNVNIVDPAEAAFEFRGIDEQTSKLLHKLHHLGKS